MILSAKQIVLITAVFTLGISYMVFKDKYDYETFAIDNVSQPTIIHYKKPHSGSYVGVLVHVKGEIDGRATLFGYLCNDADTTYHKNHYELVSLHIKGKVDTILSNEYYSSQVCIGYRPEKVQNGNLSVSVSIR